MSRRAEPRPNLVFDPPAGSRRPLQLGRSRRRPRRFSRGCPPLRRKLIWYLETHMSRRAGATPNLVFDPPAGSRRPLQLGRSRRRPRRFSRGCPPLRRKLIWYLETHMSRRAEATPNLVFDPPAGSRRPLQLRRSRRRPRRFSRGCPPLRRKLIWYPETYMSRRAEATPTLVFDPPAGSRRPLQLRRSRRRPRRFSRGCPPLRRKLIWYPETYMSRRAEATPNLVFD